LSLNEHIRLQIEAAMSADNRWHASKFYGREITDPETLLRYFIKHGGADDFGKRRRGGNGGGGQPNCGGGNPQRQAS
jgi:hypothetical protein